MKSFVFLLLCLMASSYCEATRIQRRSLVSRFSSNPFFLRHFEDTKNYYYNFGEWQRPEVKVQGITYKKEKPSEEKNMVSNQTVTLQTEKLKENITYIFKSLPYYRKPVFTKLVQKPTKHEVVPDKTLLQHDRKNFTEQVQKEVKNLGIAYVYNSLPHYDVKQRFQGAIIVEPIIDLVQEKNVQVQEQTKLIAQVQEKNVQPVQEQTKEKNIVYDFSLLPHYDTTQQFRETIIVEPIIDLVQERNVQKVQEQTKLIDQVQEKNVPIAFDFSLLPHYDARQQFREAIIVEPIIELVQEKNVQPDQEQTEPIDQVQEENIVYDFSLLPHYDKTQQFRKTIIVEPIIDLVQEKNVQQVQEQAVQDFNILPHYELRQSFAAPNLFTDESSSRKKLVKVIRRKKTFNVADFPLEDFSSSLQNVDSYGNVIV